MGVKLTFYCTRVITPIYSKFLRSFETFFCLFQAQGNIGSLIDWSRVYDQDQQDQYPISIKYHQIDPQIHLVNPLGGIFLRVCMIVTEHNLSKIGPFVGDVYNLDYSFNIFLSG